MGKNYSSHGNYGAAVAKYCALSRWQLLLGCASAYVPEKFPQNSNEYPALLSTPIHRNGNRIYHPYEKE
jgi:hypothetical protein